MGYSESTVTVERRRALLGPLFDGEPTKWECKPGDERIVAYQIRECLYIGRKNPKQFPGLARAADTMRIEILGNGQLVARSKRDSGVVATVRVEEKLSAPENPHKHLAEEHSIVGPQTAMTMIQAWVDAGSQGIFHFPQAAPSREDLDKLHHWAQAQNVLLFWKDPMVTLREHDEELAPFAFDPAEDLP